MKPIRAGSSLQVQTRSSHDSVIRQAELMLKKRWAQHQFMPIQDILTTVLAFPLKIQNLRQDFGSLKISAFIFLLPTGIHYLLTKQQQIIAQNKQGDN